MSGPLRTVKLGERVASLDVGSNTILCLVAERISEGWKRVADYHAITRVAEGLDQSGSLAEVPVARTAAELKEFRRQIDALGVTQIVATGTAPFRRARNGAEVAAALSQSLGATIDVISGTREAELALLATDRSFPELPEKWVVDIGGASTEIIFSGKSGARMVSVDVGSVRLTERCVSGAPVSESDRKKLLAAIREQLVRPEVREIAGERVLPLVGIAGTVTTVATVVREMEVYDEEVIHGCELTAEEVLAAHEKVAQSSMQQRESIAGLPIKRADVFPAGSLLLHEIMRALGAPSVVVSDRGIRWGRLFAEWS